MLLSDLRFLLHCLRLRRLMTKVFNTNDIKQVNRIINLSLTDLYIKSRSFLASLNHLSSITFKKEKSSFSSQVIRRYCSAGNRLYFKSSLRSFVLIINAKKKASRAINNENILETTFLSQRPFTWSAQNIRGFGLSHVKQWLHSRIKTLSGK